MKLVLSVIVGDELTANITRLSLLSMSTAETIHRCASRSYSTPGSVGSALAGSSVLQKSESVRLRPPRTPCLL